MSESSPFKRFERGSNIKAYELIGKRLLRDSNFTTELEAAAQKVKKVLSHSNNASLVSSDSRAIDSKENY